MADGTIKSKLQLDGEKEYRQALNDAYRSLRVLRSELKAETAEMGKNATAQDKARAKTQSLQKQITEQEKVVKTLQQALEDSRKEYEDNQEVQDKWAEKLNKAREALANMKNQLEDSRSAMQGFGEGMRDAASGSQEAMETVISFNDAMKSIGDIAKGIGNSLSGIFDATVSTMKSMVDEMFALMGQAWSAAGDWKQIQTIWGGNLEDIERVFVGAQLQGVDASAITGGIQKLVTAVHNGDKDALAALKAMGIEEKDFQSHWDFYMAVMQELTARHGTQRDQLTRALFGEKAGSGQMDVVDNWNDMMDKYGTDVEGTGLKIGAEQIEALDQVSHKIQEVQALWDVIKTSIGAKLSEVLNMDQLSEDTLAILRSIGTLLSGEGDKKEVVLTLSTQIEKLLTDISTGMGNLSDFLHELGGNLKESDNPVVSFLGQLIDSLGGVLDWLGKNSGTIIEWLNRMLPLMAANKVSEAVTGKGIGDWVTDIVQTGLQVAVLGKMFGGAAGGALASSAAGIGGGMASGILAQAGAMGSAIGAALVQAVPKLGTGYLGATWLADHTEFGRTLRDGGSLEEAFAASGKTISDWWNGIWSQENKQDFAENWDPNSENANVIAKGAGDLYQAWVQNGDNTAKFWGGVWDDVTGAVTEAWDSVTGTVSDAWDSVTGAVTEAVENMTREDHDAVGDSAYGRDTWEIPEEVLLDPVYTLEDKMQAIQDWWDAYRNADMGLDSYEEEQNAYDWMQEVLGDEFGSVMDNIIHKLDEVEDQNKLDDLPAGWFTDISGALKNLTQNDEYKGDKNDALPGLIEAACERGTARKPVQVTVYLDGSQLMDYVDVGLANSFHVRG